MTRTVLVSKLNRQLLTARLHAITGNDTSNINEACGAIFYVVMYAAKTVKFDITCPDWRIVRGALNVIYELDEGDDPNHATVRMPVLAGLDAIERIKGHLKQLPLARGVMDMSLRIQYGKGIVSAHLQNLSKGLTPNGNEFFDKNGKLAVRAVNGGPAA